MIRRLQKRFVFIVMASLLPIIIVIVGAINVLNIISTEHRVDEMLDSLSVLLESNAGSLMWSDDAGTSGGSSDNVLGEPSDSNRDIGDQNPLATFMFSQFYIVEVNDDNTSGTIRLSNETIVNDESVAEAADAILAAGSSTGTQGDFAYRISIFNDSRIILLFDTSSLYVLNISVFAISSLTGLVAYLLVFLLVAISSRRAVAPFVENYEKQKQFITNVSHELKTPLTVISANNEILIGLHGENEWSEGISRQTTRMQKLIQQMIGLTKSEEEQVFETGHFSLDEAVVDTVNTYKVMGLITGKTLETAISPSVDFKGDEAAMRQLLSLLMDNALKYCDEEGTITVKLEKGKKTSITFANSFEHADQLDYKNLFDRFYQADKARSRNEGFGLGLAIAKSIVEKHQGTLSAKNIGNTQVEFKAVFPQ